MSNTYFIEQRKEKEQFSFYMAKAAARTRKAAPRPAPTRPAPLLNGGGVLVEPGGGMGAVVPDGAGAGPGLPPVG